MTTNPLFFNPIQRMLDAAKKQQEQKTSPPLMGPPAPPKTTPSSTSSGGRGSSSSSNKSTASSPKLPLPGLGFNPIQDLINKSNQQKQQQAAAVAASSSSSFVGPPAPSQNVPVTPASLKNPLLFSSPFQQMINASSKRGQPASVVSSIPVVKSNRTVLDRMILGTILTPGLSPPGYHQTGVSIQDVAREIKSNNYRLSRNPVDAAVRNIMVKRSKIVSVDQFQREHPEVSLPAGGYDLVRVGIPVRTNTGTLVPGYQFEYSPKAIKQRRTELSRNIESDIGQLPPGLREVAYFGKGVSSGAYSMLSGFAGLIGLNDLVDQGYAVYSGLAVSNPLDRKQQAQRIGRNIVSVRKAPQDYSPLVSENPLVFAGGLGAEAGMAIIPGFAVGKVTARAAGAVARYGPRAAQALRIVEVGGFSALAAPSVYDIAATAQKGDLGLAGKKAAMFGANVAGGIEGYRLGQSALIPWGKNKGLTSYEASFKKGMLKSKLYDPLQKEYYDVMTQIKQDLRIKNIAPVQEEPTFGNVEKLEMFNKQHADVLRTAIKNQLVALKSRAQISGGAGTEKPSTGDIDQLFKSAKNPVVLDHIARKLGIDPDLVFDPHGLPRTGSIVTRSGAPKEAPYKYPSGMRGIRLTEQFYRLSDSSISLANKGREKDISEAVRIMDLLYGKSGGVPKNMQGKVARFKALSADLAANPRIMDPAESQLLYNSGFSKRFWDLRTRFYEKALSKGYLDRQFSKLTRVEKGAIREMFALEGVDAGLPPSLSMGSSSYMGMGEWSFLFGKRGRSKQSSSTSSPFGYPIPSGSRPSKSRSRSSGGSYPYNPFSPSPSGGSSSGGSSKSGSSIKSPPRSRSPPSPPSYPSYWPFGYPSSPPSSPPSRSPPYYPSSSPPSSPPSPPSPSLRFAPGGRMGGRRGRMDPFAVQYYNELETIRRLVENVIL